MNTLAITLAGACCVKACQNHCHSILPEWGYFIEWLPLLVIIVILAIIAIFVIKYGVEYNKTNKDYQFKMASTQDKQFSEIKKL